MGYAAGLEVALKERDAEIVRLRAWGERFEQSFYDTSSKAADYRAEIARLREALAFAASAIKSGEAWTPICEEVIGGALAGLQQSASPAAGDLRGSYVPKTGDVSTK